MQRTSFLLMNQAQTYECQVSMQEQKEESGLKCQFLALFDASSTNPTTGDDLDDFLDAFIKPQDSPKPKEVKSSQSVTPTSNISLSNPDVGNNQLSFNVGAESGATTSSSQSSSI
jgi:hypothetical protein